MRTELFLNEDFKTAWHGRDPFDAVNRLHGRVYRALENRKTLRFSLRGADYFVKAHRGVSWREVVKNFFHLRLPVASAKREWVALRRLRELNIDAPVPVAYGRRGGLRPPESFLVTRDVGTHVSLEDFCAAWPDQPPPFYLKRRLMEKTAEIARTMHANGMCHRDFYICHLLMKEENPPRLLVIDLHRALVKKRLSRRWKVKDVGSLYFSSMDIGLTTHDLLRFVRTYGGKSLRRSLTEDRNFWNAVKKRAIALKRKHD